MRAREPCENCFHYGKSLVTNKIECVIKDKLPVCPGDCDEYAPLEGRK